MTLLSAVSSFPMSKVESVPHAPQSRYNLTLLPHYFIKLARKVGKPGLAHRAKAPLSRLGEG
jgi:hypothetical protein